MLLLLMSNAKTARVRNIKARRLDKPVSVKAHAVPDGPEAGYRSAGDVVGCVAAGGELVISVGCVEAIGREVVMDKSDCGAAIAGNAAGDSGATSA